MIRLWPFVSVLCALAFISSRAHAFSFSPMSVMFDPTGPGATHSFTVENEADTPAAIEFSIMKRDPDIDGKEKFDKDPEIEKKFLLYPPQLLLQPKERRTLRVSWVGGPVAKTELSFRIVAEQLPIKTEKPKPQANGAVINVLLRYVGAIYVNPGGTKSEVKLKEVVAVTGKDVKNPGFTLTFENVGSMHQLLSGIEFKVKGKGQAVISPAEIPAISGQNILAGTSRRFFLPWPKAVPQGPAQVEFELKK